MENRKAETIKRGPPSTPTALKLTRGNPGKCPLNDSELRPRAGIPVCPDHLTDDTAFTFQGLLVHRGFLGGFQFIAQEGEDALSHRQAVDAGRVELGP